MSMFTGFPTILQYSRLGGVISDLKRQSEEARIELVTERPANITEELGADVYSVQLIGKAIAEVGAFTDASNRALNRAQAAQLALDNAVGPNLAGISAEVLDSVNQGNEARLDLVAGDAEAQLEAAITALNTSYAGRMLFAGDALDTPPLADIDTLLTDISALYDAAGTAAQFATDIDTYFNDPTGGFYTNIYGGGSGDAPQVEISDGELVSYHARADEDSIRELLMSLSTIVVAADKGASVEREAILNTAAVDLMEAGNGIAVIQSRIGLAQERMQNALASLDAEETALTISYNEYMTRDPYDAALRLEQFETQLQTAFVMTSRMSQLSLVNFLP